MPARPIALPLRFAAAGAAGSVPADTIAAAPLGPRTADSLFTDSEFLGVAEEVQLHRSGGLRVGVIRQPFHAAGLSYATEAIYQRIFSACGPRRLFRIWNYVPQINATTQGLENYRAFCVGRSRAFEAALGEGYKTQLPAASAVGCAGDELVVMFAAGDEVPLHYENPAQVPAYEYPVVHGPRSPSFARATLARDGGRRYAFISGTAAIRGHETIAPGSLAAQLDCTLENLRLISAAVGLGEQLTFGGPVQRHFKVYLRHAADYARARERLEESLVAPADAVLYLHADICRAALDVEIEATIVAI